MAVLKNLDLMFSVQVSTLKEGKLVPFNLFLVLPLNKRLIPFKNKQDLIDVGFTVKLLDKGFFYLYVPSAEKEIFLAYLSSEQQTENNQAVDLAVKNLEAQKNVAANPQNNPNGTDKIFTPAPGRALPPTVDPVSIKDELKKALQNMDSPDEKTREVGFTEAREIAKSLVMGEESQQSLFTDIWQSALHELCDGHARNISTIAVVFALGLGFQERGKLKNLSFAGLIHDIGMSQMDPEFVRIPMTSRQPHQSIFFEEHMKYTLEMLSEMGLRIDGEILRIFVQHHEKFDGTGYPRHLKNWEIDPFSQILSIADIFEMMMRGRYDGQKRSLSEAFSQIVKLEKSKLFPQYYNPDVFKRLVMWIETETQKTILEDADRVAQDTADENLKNRAA